MLKRLWAKLFLGLSLLVSWGLSGYIIYYRHAEQVEGSGGAFFYGVMLVFVVVMATKGKNRIKNMETSGDKLVAKLLMFLGIMMLIKMSVGFIAGNFDELDTTIFYLMLSGSGGFLFKYIAMKISIEEVVKLGGI